jgi:hypothetical protein
MSDPREPLTPDPVLVAYAGTRHMARKESEPQRPSFAASLDAKIRRRAYLEKALQLPTASQLCRRRSAARAFLAARGFDTAEPHAVGAPLAALAGEIAGRNRLVVKPVHGTNAWGVMGLVRLGDGRFRDVLRGGEHTPETLVASLAETMARFSLPDQWLVEELLLPPGGEPGLLGEYKVYAFRGAVPLVLQVRGFGEGRRYKWYDADWRHVATGKYEGKIDASLPLPADPAGILSTARALSDMLPMPFCRIDILEADRGPVIGELTPEPGTYHAFSPDVDLMLGALYEQAEARLLADLASGKAPSASLVVPL